MLNILQSGVESDSKTTALIIAMTRTSLVAQWLRICLPMPETWVPSLVWEDPTCDEATKPVHHNY